MWVHNQPAAAENIARDAKGAWPEKKWGNRPIAWTESIAKKLLSPPSHPEMMGRIGRYEVERLIGAGGMGVVFKAFDTELNRPVAIKLLAPFLARSLAPRLQRILSRVHVRVLVVDEAVPSLCPKTSPPRVDCVCRPICQSICSSPSSPCI